MSAGWQSTPPTIEQVQESIAAYQALQLPGHRPESAPWWRKSRYGVYVVELVIYDGEVGYFHDDDFWLVDDSESSWLPVALPVLP